METEFCRSLLQLVHSTHLNNLMALAKDEERYEHAALIRDEIADRVKKGFMQYVGEGEDRFAVTVQVLPD